MENGLDIEGRDDKGRDDNWWFIFPALGGGLVGMKLGSETGGLLGGIVGFLIGAVIAGGGAFIALILLATGG